MGKYEKKWHKTARDIFIASKGICNATDIQKGLLDLVKEKSIRGFPTPNKY